MRLTSAAFSLYCASGERGGDERPKRAPARLGRPACLLDGTYSACQTIRHARDPNEQHLRNELRAIADGLKDVLSERFDPHSLLLTQIERTSPLTVLQKVVDTESVHPLASVDAFKARLGKGRKCWAFFHPLLPEVLPLSIPCTARHR
ncbi:uncharacterized protein ACA1_197460 [Acanthamoeba castellanii str. Neff]|uniref:Malonyl-CoA decarboxylase C-terminal domain-containing protein n=1 Tax=Acanthamoeba castellanii (strain ATCC 30010 / Neff) TaxID=1257118 RepID=L8H581_ACACF|nr:uncharacterized protein ACA1_197460 [Acanthamoeba castellanii str. Neff]ELR19586.1 hypothetical protein ACA1_197460 [Acanthamoeba castellanii str. Neff]